MSNVWYAEGAQYVAEAGLNWNSDAIIALLVSDAYTPNTGAGGDKFISSISGPAIISRSGSFTAKTDTGGILNAATINFSLPAAGNNCPYIVIAKNTGVDATSHLLVKIDTANGLPVETDGGDIAVQWDAGTFKIAAIGVLS